MGAPRVLIVDDEESIRYVLHSVLEEFGCDIREGATGDEALGQVESWTPEVALTDLIMPGMHGLELLAELKRRTPDTEVVVMTSHGSAATALQAMRLGAFDYLEKPIDPDAIWETVQRAREKRSLQLETRELLRKQEQKNLELSASVALGDDDQAIEIHWFKEILEHYLDVVTEKLDVERASLMLLDRRTGEMRIAAQRGLPEIEVDRIRVHLGQGIAGKVAQTGEPFLVTNTKAEEGFEESPYPGLSDSFISAPLALSVAIKTGPEILGVINVTNRRSGKPMGGDDLSFLSALAGQLAVAIDATVRSVRLQRAYKSLKTAQHQLVFTEKIKAVGQMAAGVAHDFNNALSVILARAEFIRASLDGSAPDMRKVRSDLDTIIKIAFQGAETIKRIQDYTRIRKDVPNAAVDLNGVIRDAVEMSRPKWKDECEAEGKQIEICCELEEIPPVSGNEYELAQVVGNFIFNAVEAMPQGGRLTLRTRSEEDRVVMEVQDTGIGMDQTTRERLFDPFFTTKESGQGLGSSIIFGIVTRHRGEIAVDSKLGQGTCFRVKLPLAQVRPRTPAPEKLRLKREACPARVLLVDDDDLVRETYEEMLSAGGHQVVAASGGAVALEELARGEFDLVVTDLSMAEMSGFELAQEVKRLDPAMPIVLLSGWAIQEHEERVRQAGIDHVLVKPCMVKDLLRTVREAARKPAPA